MASEAPATEIWLPIPGHDGYEASNTMQVRSVDRVVEMFNQHGPYLRTFKGKVLSQRTTSRGYMTVTIGVVHRLVCMAFHGPPPSEDSVARHLDDDKMNNSPGNLAWGSVRQNNVDSVRNGKHRNQNSTKVSCSKDGHPEVFDTVGSEGHRRCSVCVAAYKREWADRNRDRVRKRKREWARKQRRRDREG